MPKFYVQSGTVSLVLQANDAEAAAIWTIHRTLAPALPFADDRESHDEDGEDYSLAASESGIMPLSGRLGETTQVSQRGFGGDDCGRYNTLQLVQYWSELLLALDNLKESA